MSTNRNFFFFFQWEDKIRRESVRLKLELEKTYKEEKRHLIEEFKTKADEQLKQNDQAWEKKMIDNKNEVRKNYYF